MNEIIIEISKQVDIISGNTYEPDIVWSLSSCFRKELHGETLYRNT